jgi:hypothetical protein
MRIHLSAIIFFFCAVSANAQMNKAFLNDTGGQMDSLHATEYIMYDQVSDTAWVMKLYKMNGSIIQIGTYKDKKLSIPNGKFTYYSIASSKSSMAKKGLIDTLNRIRKTGYFVNGIKCGVWTDYINGGKVRSQSIFKNGKLNGLFKGYYFIIDSVCTQGNYVDDKKEDEWDSFDTFGNILFVDIYKDDKIIKHTSTPVEYKMAVAPDTLYAYISESYKKSININLSQKILIAFTITADGKLIEPEILTDGVEDQTKNILLSIISKSSIWQPAYNIKTKKSTGSISCLSVIIENGALTINNTVDDKIFWKYYRNFH